MAVGLAMYTRQCMELGVRAIFDISRRERAFPQREDKRFVACLKCFMDLYIREFVASNLFKIDDGTRGVVIK